MYTQINEDDKVMNKIKPLLEKGETARISERIKYQEKYYREIIVEKKELLNKGTTAKGYIYVVDNTLDNDMQIVQDKGIQKEVSRLGYYYETFLDEDKKTSIIKALKKEGDINRDTNDFQDVSKALVILKKEDKINDAESMKNTMDKVLKIRLNLNESINKFADYVNDFKKNNMEFNEETLTKAYDLFEEVMELNFENVRAIGEIKSYADTLKDSVKKKRKKLVNRFNTKITGPLFKVEYQIEYFKRIIRTYEKVLDMNVSQYMKFFKSNQLSSINERYNLTRR